MSIFTYTCDLSLCASTCLIQGVRFGEQAEIKARPVAAKVSVYHSVPDQINEKCVMQMTVKA